MSKNKRGRDEFEESSIDIPTTDFHRKVTKNIKPDTNAISERTINIMMSNKKTNQNSSKSESEYSNGHSSKDVEMSAINPNIPDNYFNSQDTCKGYCRSCFENKSVVRTCPSCSHYLCPSCAHYCEQCNIVVCSLCCIIDYDQRCNVDYCIDCNISRK
ncbi:hypothetical protein DLAC_07831 [Tieghemostelium lacteum]|uniref:RING-type domain-containing protein n=1 Tax=Tieghemostelium lacteum TaxID=361077 RepID=A0A151ZAI7_TIELA|nr:hypothetical protein DLAC_07831 [Tieghemostelium lacteum]|eukprot:KYQ90951.1 hypothetical protein DLAC_07831 [Tieghemostelium lacteum]